MPRGEKSSHSGKQKRIGAGQGLRSHASRVRAGRKTPELASGRSLRTPVCGSR